MVVDSDPRTPTDNCAEDPGYVFPVIDRNRCEAKADCVAVCPYSVFEVSALTPAERAGLSLRGRLKAWLHGGRQAHVVRAQDCHACAQCLVACPEGAISLRRAPKRP